MAGIKGGGGVRDKTDDSLFHPEQEMRERKREKERGVGPNFRNDIPLLMWAYSIN